MSESSPFFSVIIPTRNRPIEFLEALNSVLDQTCDDLEVIVVNDGTSEIHRLAYDQLEANKPENVSYINLIERSRGHGHCFARNEGVTASKGQHICFLDDDDTWTDNNFLLRAKKEIIGNKSDFYISNQKAITHDGKEIKNVWVEDIPSLLNSNDPRLKSDVFQVEVSELLSSQGFAHQNVSIASKSLFEQAGGMDECLRYEPDRDIYLRLLDNANIILYDKSVVALHNVPDQSKSNNASTKTKKLEKLLFQLRTANKGLLFSNRKEIYEFCKTFKLHTLKHIAEELVKENKLKEAYIFAKEALAIKFSLKWFLRTRVLWLQNLFFGNK